MYSPIINCLLLSNLILFSKAAYISNRTLLDIEDLYRTLQKDLVEYQENQSVEQPENRFTGICQNLVSCQEGGNRLLETLEKNHLIKFSLFIKRHLLDVQA